MPRHTCSPRVPLGNIDPLRCAADALAVFSLVAQRPAEFETIVVLLDRQRIGSVVVSVANTSNADSFVPIIERLAQAACPQHMQALVAMTRRPGGTLVDRDVDRWLEASAVASRQGVELVEWFIDGRDGIECPRDLLGEPERW